jgi:hypothetical protein
LIYVVGQKNVSTCGENCTTQRKVYQQVEGFQSGRTNVVDEDHSGHPIMSQIAEIVEGVNDLVQEDRQITH